MAVTHGQIDIVFYKSSKTEESEIDLTRQRISEMSDTELLRFGVTAKHKCSQELSKHPRLEPLVVQLTEARAEWIRRHPALPLSISF